MPKDKKKDRRRKRRRGTKKERKSQKTPSAAEETAHHYGDKGLETDVNVSASKKGKTTYKQLPFTQPSHQKVIMPSLQTPRYFQFKFTADEGHLMRPMLPHCICVRYNVQCRKGSTNNGVFSWVDEWSSVRDRKSVV